MSESNSADPCPRCGEPRLDDRNARLCPRCLARAMFSPEPPEPPAAEGITPVLRRLGDYELIEEVARGGMGIVFRARQIGLDRIVAVKLMRDGTLATPDDVRRFRAEASAAARLNHPGIVAIHEVGAEDGQHFFAMDLVRGRNLAELTRDGPLPLREAAELTARIAEAVQHAHEQGLLHRDLKPSNVLVDAEGRPHVTDFGLALPLDGGSDLTRTGQVLGTPGYLAPEQAFTHHGAVGPAADVYGLGAILYHLLTARPPFVGERLADLLRQVGDHDPIHPAALNVSVPASLSAICQKCLRKEPARRYASARALAEDLVCWLDGKPTQARAVTTFERGALWVQRHPWRAAALFVIFALLATIGATSTSLLLRLQGERKRTLTAQGQAEQMLWEACLAQANAERIAGQSGSRARALEAIRRAAQFRAEDRLRDEAVAALSLTDWRGGPLRPFPRGAVGWMAIEPHRLLGAWATSTGDLVVLNALTGAEQFRLPTGPGNRGTHAFSPDGEHLGVYLTNGMVQCWNLAARTQRWSVAIQRGPAQTPLAFVPGQPWVALGTTTNQLRRVQLANGKATDPIDLPWTPDAFAFSPDGTRLALRDEHRALVLEMASRHTVAEFTNRAVLTAWAWHPDGRRLALGTETGDLLRWEPDHGILETWRGDRQFVATLAFEPQGQLLVSGHWNSISQVWDFELGQRHLRHEGAMAIAFDASGQRLACQLEGKIFGLVDLNRPQHLRSLTLPLGVNAPYALAFSADGGQIAGLSRNGIHLWEVGSGRLVAFSPATAGGQLVSFTADQQALVSGDGHQLWRWALETDAQTGAVRLSPPRAWPAELDRSLTLELGLERGHRLFPRDVKFYFTHPPLRFVDLEGPGETFRWTTEGVGSWSLAPDASRLALAGRQGLLVQRLDGSRQRMETALVPGVVLFSPDGKRLAHFSSGRLEMFDPASGQLLWSLPQETGTTLRPTYSSDGRILAIGGTSSKQVWLVDPTQGQRLAVLTPPTDSPVATLAFSPDNRTLAVAHERHILFWNLPRLREELARIGLPGPGPDSANASQRPL